MRGGFREPSPSTAGQRHRGRSGICTIVGHPGLNGPTHVAGRGRGRISDRIVLSASAAVVNCLGPLLRSYREPRVSFATSGANSHRSVPSSAPPSERSRMRPRPDVAKGIEPNLAPVPRALLERYVTGFRDLTAVYLKGEPRTGTSDDEDPVCCVECA
jgi:hypothetical protein